MILEESKEKLLNIVNYSKIVNIRNNNRNILKDFL